MCPFQKHFFSFCNSILNCNFGIFWKVLISHNQLMKLISEEISTCRPSMTIIYCEKRTSWPVLNLFEFRFNYIKNYRYSVLIIISDNTLMSICWVTADNTILLTCKFGRMVGGNKSIDLLLFHLHIFLLLLNCHYESSICCELVLTFWMRNVGVTVIRRLFDFLMSWGRLGSALIFVSSVWWTCILWFVPNARACSKFVDSRRRTGLRLSIRIIQTWMMISLRTTIANIFIWSKYLFLLRWQNWSRGRILLVLLRIHYDVVREGCWSWLLIR